MTKHLCIVLLYTLFADLTGLTVEEIKQIAAGSAGDA